MLLDPAIRNEFPILTAERPSPLVYFDSAATSFKPRAVIDAVVGFYTECTANVHRSVHALSEDATERFEAARDDVARLVGADSREIAFTRNATEALNIVAANFRGRGKVAVAPGEHHSNYLPWLGDSIIRLPLTAEGAIDAVGSAALIREQRPAIVTLALVSNALGVEQPVAELAEAARDAGAAVCLDLSQAVGHMPVDLNALRCDYACFAGHKMLGPSGVGILYRREGTPVELEPVWLGGEMIHEAHIDSFQPRPFPWCLEAGTPNIEGVIGLGAAARFLDDIGIDAVHEHCLELADTLRNWIEVTPALELVTPPGARTANVTFAVPGQPSHGVSRILSNRFGIMVRSGFHCAQPLHELLGRAESLRASIHLYNTVDDVERLKEALTVVADMAPQ